MAAGHSTAGWLEEADCVLVLDVDVPWCPEDAEPASDARVFQVGSDPLHQRIPLRSHRANRVITAHPRLLLEALLATPLELDRTQRAALTARSERIAALRARQAAKLAAQVDAAGCAASITPLWVAACIREVWEDDLVLVNELSLPAEPLGLERPGSYFRASAASALGWGGGAALGLGLGRPTQLPVLVVGDGAWLFANPAVVHQTASAHRVPLVIVVLNNAGMHSIGAATRSHYPALADPSVELPLTSFEPSVDFAALCRSCGGYGERVQAPHELAAALRRVLGVARSERKQALLEVICS
jgi:acetolactate synthase I/II/III large subunit